MISQAIPAPVRNVLTTLKVRDPVLLGKGGEGYVFTFTSHTAIKIYKPDFKGQDKRAYLESLEQLQRLVSGHNLPFATPQIVEIGVSDGVFYTIEKKLSGVLMEDRFPSLPEREQHHLLRSYYEAVKTLNDIELPELPFGNLVETAPKPILSKTWPEFILESFDQKTGGTSTDRLRRDVIDFDVKADLFKQVVGKELAIPPAHKSLVHADYFVNQVLVSNKNEISAVLDISYHAVAGDRRLDAAGVFFFEAMKHYTKKHVKFLLDMAIRDYGLGILKFNDIYRLYYCFYFSDVYSFMPAWYETLVGNLNDKEIWVRIHRYLQD